MNIVLFYHSLLSDWNHGNAHFLRGIATELKNDGHIVTVYEEENNWSYSNMLLEKENNASGEFEKYYPGLKSVSYNKNIRLDIVLKNADLVIVHEWSEHSLVKKIGEMKKQFGFKLLFHDTHHRSVTEKKAMKQYDLSQYDGVLAYGKVIRDIYLKKKWAKKAWVWHEAADTNIFKPMYSEKKDGDLVWIGNWGDDERTKEIHRYIIEPVKKLGLKAKIYGVRYPADALKALKKAGIEYGGWLPNFKVPEVFSKYRFTVHVPRGPYTKSLPGIPTIRPFEAMACGIPLISSPWNDTENLFTKGKDYLMADGKKEMKKQIKKIMKDDELVNKLSQHGLKTILEKHTCAHRVNELYNICEEIGINISKKITA